MPSVEPHVELELTTLRTGPEPRWRVSCSTNRATRVPGVAAFQAARREQPLSPGQKELEEEGSGRRKRGWYKGPEARACLAW